MTFKDSMKSLSKPQMEGVITTEGPVLLLSGAGSGKTRVITTKIAYLIEELGINPDSIMAVTFTNKAAREMKSRVCALLPNVRAYRLWVKTFHSSCMAILKENATLLGYTRNFSILDTNDAQAIIKKIVKDEKIILPAHLKIKTLMRKISDAKNNLILPKDYLESDLSGEDYTAKLVADIYKKYVAFTKKENAMDFDDLILKAVILFRKESSVLDTYKRLWRYILVDEFQDTNHSQYELVKLLTDSDSNLTAVGDDDQSIYSFRGAIVENILNFPKDYPKTKVIRLEENYRCGQNIVEIASKLILNNQKRHDKKVFSSKQNEYPIEIWHTVDERDEASYVVNEIETLMNNGFEIDDMVILFRTNSQSRLFESSLMSYGIPYRVIGAFKFFERAEIKDATSYLRLCLNPNENLSLRRIINTPARGIGDKTLSTIEAASLKTGKSMFSVLEEGIVPLSKKSKASLNILVNAIKESKIRLEKNDDAQIVMLDLLEELNYYSTFKDDYRSEDARENVDQLANAIRDYMTSEGVTTEDFLSEVSLMTDADKTNDEGVSLMTTHNAKGLEFDIVFLTGMEEGLFPHIMSYDSERGIEEERRLCYVGITRAKRKLYLTRATYRRGGHGETFTRRPSRFLKEINDENIIEKDIGDYRSKVNEIDENAFEYYIPED